MHRSVLGEGSRRSCFFAAAFNEQFKTDTTDLTELLPLACHDCFEAVLDFVYGHEIMFTLANAIKIHKIADVLQIVPLLTLAEVAIQQHAVPYTCSMLELAIELQVSVPAAKALLSRWRPSDIARCISKFASNPLSGDILEYCAELMRPMEESLRLTTFGSSGSGELTMHGVLKVQGTKIVQFKVAEGTKSTCRIRVVTWSDCFGSAIGVSEENACFTSSTVDEDRWHATSRDGGFAELEGCWGLGTNKEALLSEGVTVGDVPHREGWLVGKLLRMDLDQKQGTLRFVLEQSPDEDLEIGTITADFKRRGQLYFTLSTCCSGSEIQLLD